MTLAKYINQLKQIAANAKDVSPFVPTVERKAVEIAGENIIGIGTYTKIDLVGSPSAIKKLARESPLLSEELFREITLTKKKGVV